MSVTPQNRLLFWFGAIVVPFALVGAVAPGALLISVVTISLLIVIAIADALYAPRRLARIEVRLPAVARMSRNRPARLEMRIRNPPPSAPPLRLALALPSAIQSAQEHTIVTLPRDSEWSQLSWPCVPLQRGRHAITAAYVGTSSSLGFWTVRKRLNIHSEVRVYPNLMRDRRELAALFLHRSRLGLHAQRQIGRGREFEKLREYIPGDGYDEIHWKATAKRGHPVTKVFQIERTQEVYVVIDSARLSGRRVPEQNPSDNQVQAEAQPASATTTLDRFITAALTLGLATEQQGDLFGLVSFSNKVDDFVRARNGKAHYDVCRDVLYRLEPQEVSPDFDELFSFIRLRLRHRALLIFLTALDDPVLAESFVRNLELIRRQHMVLVNMVRPPGIGRLFSDRRVDSVDDIYLRLGGHLLWHNLRELQKVLERRGVRFGLLQNERLSAELVSQYLDVKRRQAL